MTRVSNAARDLLALAPKPLKLHTTIYRGDDGKVELREMSMCHAECPDFHRDEGAGELIRLSGEILERK